SRGDLARLLGQGSVGQALVRLRNSSIAAAPRAVPSIRLIPQRKRFVRPAEAVMKRIVLFLLTNLAVLVVLSVVTNLLGLNQALAANGLNLSALLTFSAIVGFGGAFISLLLSKTIAKWSTGAQVLSQPRTEGETWLLATVKRLAGQGGTALHAGGVSAV